MPEAFDPSEDWRNDHAVPDDHAVTPESFSHPSEAAFYSDSSLLPSDSPLWERILENIPMGVAVLNAQDGRTLWANNAMRRLLLAGVGMSDVLSWLPYEYLPNLELETWQTILQRVNGATHAEVGGNFGRLQFVHHATRNIAYWEWNLQRLQPNETGTPCLLLTVQNVSDVVINERQLATAVRHSQQARKDAEALGNFAQLVNRSLTTHDLLCTTVKEIAGYFETSHAAVLLSTSGRQQLNVGYSVGVHLPPTSPQAQIRPEATSGSAPHLNRIGTAADIAMRAGSTLVTSDCASHGICRPLLPSGKLPATLISCPIRQNDRTFGVVEVYFSEPREIPEASVQFLSAIADQTAVSLVKAELYEQIAVQRSQLQSIFDNAPVGILYFNAEGVAVAANAAIARSYGQSVEEIVGRQGSTLMPGLSPRIFEMAQEGTPFHASHVVFASAPGENVIYDVSLIPVNSEHGLSGLLLLMFEVTELVEARQEADAARKDAEDALAAVRATQAQMVQMEKLRAVGELAQGVAHDINNALTAVLGYTELAEDDLSRPEVLAQYLATIKKAAEDATSTVKRLNRFAKQGVSTHGSQTDINEVVTDVVQLTRPRWRNAAQKEGHEYVVETHLEPLPPVMGEPSGLREVLMNMIHNALNAMPNGGSLTLSTHAISDKEVEIEVADTGMGMTPEVKNRIFDPFFTTRGVEGTGLGLAVSWGIIQRHGGTINVESEPDQGTHFHIRLPVSQMERIEETPLVPPALIADAPGTPVLVVDDEPIVAGVLSSILGRHGYRVTMVHSGQEALEKLNAPDAEYQLVTTDHGMPGMNGLQLVAEIKRVHPKLPVLLLTGWGESVLQTNVPEAMPDAILGKPINKTDLLEALAQLTPQKRN